MNDPDDLREIIEKTAEAANIFYRVQDIWLESNATTLQIKTSRRYNEFVVNRASCAKQISMYLSSVMPDAFLSTQHYPDNDPYYTVSCGKIAEVHLRLSKKKPA